MSTSIRFREHEEFHRAALHMAVAGAGAGLAAHVAGLLFPAAAGLGGPIALALIAGAAAYGAAPPARRIHLREILVVVLGIAAGAAALKLFAKTGPEPSLGAAVFALAFGALIARYLGVRRFVVTLASAAGAALLARFVLTSFVGAPAFATLPAWVTATISGAAFALVGVLGLLPRHLDLRHDRVGEAWGAAKDRLTGELGELTGRAMMVWNKVDQTLEPDAAARKAIEDSVLRLFEVARKWQSVEAESAPVPAEKLVARMDEIEAKIARTEDPVARGQYERARAALSEQLRYVNEIATSRERVVARMHHYLAAMERLRFAVINHRSADASRLSTEVQPILDDLESLGKEIDITAEAIGEVEKEEADRVAGPN